MNVYELVFISDNVLYCVYYIDRMKCTDDGYISPIPLNKHYIYLLRFIRLFNLMLVDTHTRNSYTIMRHLINYKRMLYILFVGILYDLCVCVRARVCFYFFSFFFSFLHRFNHVKSTHIDPTEKKPSVY